MAKNISDLPHALAHSDELTRLLDVRSARCIPRL